MLVAMSLYGVEAWTRNADAFGVYFGLFAALAPLERRDGWLVARPPVVGAGRVDGRVAGTVAVLLAGIGVTAFDGMSQGSLFNDLLPHLQDVFAAIGFGRPTALELGFTTGLCATVALVALIWLLARPGPRLAGSLTPILAAYVVAHYFSLLAYNGQDLARLASDPLGDGSDLFGTASATIDYGVVSATGIWYVQVGALVLGHVAGLVRAHDRALVVQRSHPGRDPLAAGHAGADGLLHLPGTVAAVGRERMTVVVAHAGHWLAQLAYLAPLVLLIAMLVVGRLRERRERRRNSGVTKS